MFTLDVALVLAMLSPATGPLDAFRINYASIKAEMDFRVTGGVFTDNNRLWDGRVPHYIERHERDLDTTIVGHWACDGAVEYLGFGSPEEVLRRASKGRLKQTGDASGASVWFLKKTEALWDGQLLIWHDMDPRLKGSAADLGWRVVRATVADDDVASCLEAGRGPLNWGNVFPHVLRYYGDPAPSSRRAVRWGYPTEMEVCRRERPDGEGWIRLEVSYDPAVGYLPRFVRELVYDPSCDLARSNEMYLIEARPCGSGGFVPVEWYNIKFGVPRFQARFPRYDESTDLAPAMTKVDVSHFQASDLRDLSGPVALKETRGVHSIAAVGGRVVRPSLDSPLTRDTVRALLGEKISAPSHGNIARIEPAALHDFHNPPSGASWPYVLLLVAVCLGLAWIPKTRRGRAARALLALAALQASSGCGFFGGRVTMLSAAYKDTFVYLERPTRKLPSTLVLRNDGNKPLRLLGAAADSNYRSVDRSSFPLTLRPGGMAAVRVRLSGLFGRTAFQLSRFEFDTDGGHIFVAVPFYTLASHELNPEVISRGLLDERGTWEFRIAHRMVFRADLARPRSELRFPRELTVTRRSILDGRVFGAPWYAYQEVNYQVKLNDYTVGMHKASIAVVDDAQPVSMVATVLWRRVPFLSSVPDRAVLGTRPMRVFLHCADEGVRLTRVLAAPQGVKAFINSATEVSIVPTGPLADAVNGAVEVSTTSERHALLRIPVVGCPRRVARTVQAAGATRPIRPEEDWTDPK